MITNSELTIYHKTLDTNTRLEKWIRHNYENVWWFSAEGASTREGYEKNNMVSIRIPYKINTNLSKNDFSIRRYIVYGKIRSRNNKSK